MCWKKVGKKLEKKLVYENVRDVRDDANLNLFYAINEDFIISRLNADSRD